MSNSDQNCESQKTTRIAVFPGTFDPFTKGHMDLVKRALSFFDRVTVAVLINDKKATLFKVEERCNLIRSALKDVIERVDIDSFSGLLVDYLKTQNQRIVIRGLRAISDFDYEAQMAIMNRNLAPEVETFFLMSREEYSYISSSLVRQVALLGGDVSKFVAPSVADAISLKVKSQ
jgi:pantetheine-phosphate adenylyltransferase